MSPTLTVLCQAASSLSGWPISTQLRGAFYTLNHLGDGDFLIVLNGLNMVCLSLILVLITFGLPSGSVSVSKFFVLLLWLPCFQDWVGEKKWVKVLKSKRWRNACWNQKADRQLSLDISTHVSSMSQCYFSFKNTHAGHCICFHVRFVVNANNRSATYKAVTYWI